MKENSVLNICAVIAVGLYGLTIYWDYGVTPDRVEANRVEANRVEVNRFPVNRVPVNRFPVNRFAVNRVEANVLCESPAGKAQNDARNLNACIPSQHVSYK
jgi:hypothetical protein